MQNENNSYRIRTQVNPNEESVLNVKLNQSFEFLNILSLQIGQKNLYKIPAAPYGVIVGRVLLGGKSFGIPNAKISVFIPKDGTVFNVKDDILYAYSSVDSVNYDGIKYNLLPSYVDEVCHQNVGTMFEKEYVLDNNDVIHIFDTYYTYTTRSNNSGDYFIYGIPVGQHTLHVDVDLSDIGVLSVRPHDMVGQGYNIDQFESPNKFRADKNLNILPQIKTQNKPVYVYPFWGDTTDDDTNASITRCDIEIDYKFEPTAVFMGSIITDKGTNSISQKCVPSDLTGKMSELITGEGKIEMIRKTFDGKVEQFSVKGNRLIDGDGTWCYQIPMNLDYVVADEFGNIVPTDNPEIGLPTRARVRFRVSLDEAPDDDGATKRARFLIPNNPRIDSETYPAFTSDAQHEADYEFGTYTKEESYRDMFWNDVYTVKSYIPRLQKKVSANIKKYTGVKTVNHAGDNNPMPFNNLYIKLNFVYRVLCLLITVFSGFVSALNVVLMSLGNILMDVGYIIGRVFNDAGCKLQSAGAGLVVSFDNPCEEDSSNKFYLLPDDAEGSQVIANLKKRWIKKVNKFRKARCSKDDTSEFDEIDINNLQTDVGIYLNCAQNALAQENEVTSFDFYNDWINGVLYAPLWYRKIKPNKKIFFGLIEKKGVDDWCDGSNPKMAKTKKGLKIFHSCAQKREFRDNNKSFKPVVYDPNDYLKEKDKGNGLNNERTCYGSKCHKKTLSYFKVDKGLVIRKETKTGEYVYYYKPVEYSQENFNKIIGEVEPNIKGDVKLLFATDLALLGNLNTCNEKGVPQFFRSLTETTYNMPPDLISMDWKKDDENVELDENGDIANEGNNAAQTEYTGADYGNAGYDQWHKPEKANVYVKEGDNRHDNGGLFYNLNCANTYVKPKCCINLSRICEFGVNLDQSITFVDESGNSEHTVIADGFISYDEIYNMDGRSMFATMNGNRLRCKTNSNTGFPEYDFIYFYPENFDGLMSSLMSIPPGGYSDEPSRGVDGPWPNSGSNSTSVTYKDNHVMEQSSDAYLRFRYGYLPNQSQFQITFYQPQSDNHQNRIPRYENSFYFYFGLKNGKTAIEKFRRLYYAECTNDEASESPLGIEYKPNSWCSVNGSGTNANCAYDGYILFDLSRLELPCKIYLDEESDTYLLAKHEKVGIGMIPEGSEYKRLMAESCNGDDCDEMICISNDGEYITSPTNKNYNIRIVDNDGKTYEQRIVFQAEKLSFNVNVVDFVLSIDELENISDIAQYENRDEIGGYLTINNLFDQGESFDEGFTIEIKLLNDDTFHFIYRKTCNLQTETIGNVYMDDTNDGEYTFGLPKANAYYDVIVSKQCCEQAGTDSENTVVKRVYVKEGESFKMKVNEVDVDLLERFDVGFEPIDNSKPYTINDQYDYDSQPPVVVDKNKVKGWLDIDKVGFTELIPVPEDGDHTAERYNELTNLLSIDSIFAINGTPYTFTREYCYKESDVIIEPPVVDSPPNTPAQESDSYDFLCTIDENNTSNYIYWQKNPTNTAYVITDHQPPTIEDYFVGSKYYAKQIITVMNIFVDMRLRLVDDMIRGFYLYENDEDFKDAHITYTPSSLSCDYFNYKNHDTDEDGQVMYEGYVPSDGDNPMWIFDNNPTIIPYYAGDGNEYPIFNQQTNIILPPASAIFSSQRNESRPTSFNPQSPQFEDMFRYHFIDKRPCTDITVWVPMNGWPIYAPHIPSLNPNQQYPTGYLNQSNEPIQNITFDMNGCLSGYIYNCFSEKNDIIPVFSAMTIGENGKLITVTRDTNDVTKPDEFHVPTRRLIYWDRDEDTSLCGADLYISNGDSANFFNNFDPPLPSNTSERYVSVSKEAGDLSITDRFTVFTETLFTDSSFGLKEDTVLPLTGYLPQNDSPSFQGQDVAIEYFIVHDTQNPIYTKFLTQDERVITDNLPIDMRFHAMNNDGRFGNYNNYSIPQNAKCCFMVGRTEDRKFYGISPTYECGPVNYTLDTVTNKITIIDNTDSSDANTWYLKYYRYDVIVEVLDNNSQVARTYSKRMEAGYYEVDFADNDIDWSHSQVYVKDVTKIKRIAQIIEL